MPDRALIYVRQSLARRGETEDTSLSLDSQEAACRALCDRHGWIVAAVVRDHDLKGSDQNRPGMRELMEQARRHEIDVAVVFSMSRLARDAPYQELTWRELRRLKVRVESVNEPNIDHTLLRGVLGVVNQYRSEEIGQHISAAVRVRSAAGKTWGRVPLGFRRVDGILVPDPVEAAIVGEVFAWWLSGLSLRQIAARLIEAGVPPRSAPTWGPHTVAWMLRNPVYAGHVRLAGKIVSPGAHEAVVSAETWDQAQKRFGAPRVNENKRCRSWVEGRVLHSCGARMHLTLIPRTHPSPRYPDGYPSFRCQNWGRVGARCTEPRQHIGQPLLEEAVRECLIADLAGALDPQAAMRRSRSLAGSARSLHERAKLDRQLAAIEGQRREAESLVLTRRRDTAWLDERDREFAAAEAAIRQRIAALPSVPDEAAIGAASRRARSLRAQLPLMDETGLGDSLGLVGVAVVSAEGVTIRYASPWDALIPEPVTVVPRRGKG